MTRREFSIALGGVAFPVFGSGGPVVRLQAIAGARLPQTLVIATRLPEKLRRHLWELRTYTGADTRSEIMLGSRLAEVFPRAGIHPLLQDKLTYLIPFEDLTARDRAWTVLNADPEWIRVRTQFQAYHFGLYRAA